MTVFFAAMLADVDDFDRHMGQEGGWWVIIFGALMMAAVVVLVVWLVRNVGTAEGSQSDDDPLDSARRILAERYANGELTTDEYRERMAELARR